MVYRNHRNDSYIGMSLIISTIRFFKTFTAELHLTKSQHVDYHIFENILFRDYLNFNTQKVSFIFLKDNILPLCGIRVNAEFEIN